VNGPRCSDVDEVKAIGSTGSVLAPRLLVLQVEFCVFQDVVRETRGHGESRTVPRPGFRLEVDSAIEVTRQPDSHVGGRGRGNLQVEGTSVGGHRAALSRRWSAWAPGIIICNERGTHHLGPYVTFHTSNMHIHPVVKRLGAGTVLRQDERDINSLLVLDSHVPVVCCATIFNLVWTGGYIGLDAGEHGAITWFF